jgi:hypothetical protein
VSSRPRSTVDDRPSATPEDRPSSVDGSTVSPAERHSSEPPTPAPVRQEDPLVAPDEPAVRVVALVMAASLVGLAGWLVAYGWRMFTDVLAGRVSKDVAAYTWPLLALIVLLPPVVRRLWLVARRGVDPESEGEGIEAVESRAFLEAVERHDRLLEAQRLAAEEVGGDLDAESRPEGLSPPPCEPTDRGYEARIAARMKERGDPG